SGLVTHTLAAGEALSITHDSARKERGPESLEKTKAAAGDMREGFGGASLEAIAAHRERTLARLRASTESFGAALAEGRRLRRERRKASAEGRPTEGEAQLEAQRKSVLEARRAIRRAWGGALATALWA